MRVKRQFGFEAAHRLPNHPGKCRELHGHSFRLEVTVEGPIEPASGMVIDFAEVKRIVRDQVVDRLDHAYANDLIENPTAERIAQWSWAQLKPALPGLVEVELWETSNCSVVYRGE